VRLLCIHCKRHLTKTSVLRAILDIFFVMARAGAAAQLYAELSRKCDRELAAQGYKRADIPRAAYNELTKG
jgi:hypothetical protein